MKNFQEHVNTMTGLNNNAEIKLFSRIQDWIRFAVSEFHRTGLHFGHGTDNPLDEAVYLILFALNLPADTPQYLFDSVLTTAERNKVFQMIQKRIKTRKPAAYLTNESFFMGLPFYVDSRVLIPRSPVAELIEKQFYPWIASEQVNSILDLCTGSGCIATACAHMFPNARIIASDISEDALTVAKINIDNHQKQDQINLIKSDLFQKIPAQRFDIIISNPPYVDKTDMSNLPKEYQHEPELALKAGKDGLKIIRQILSQAKKYLSPHGILIVETGNSYQALIQEFPHLPFTWLEFEKGDSEVFLLTYSELSNLT